MSVQKLYVVGYTSDLRGLVLSRQKGVRSGGFVLELDGKLRRAVGEIDTLREETRYGRQPVPGKVIESSVEAEEAPAEASPTKRLSRGVLSPKEIQAELRAGRTVQEVARIAGTDVSWIERFLSPILAERKGIVDLVLAGTLSRPRRGKSGCNVGDAIAANLRERSLVLAPDGLAQGWSVARRNGRWEVTFRVPLRNQEKDAEFAYEPESGVTALNPTALQIGWRAPEPHPLPDTNVEPDAGPEDPAPPPAVGDPRPDVGQGVAALWGATKPMPPTAPARRSVIGGGKAGQGGGSQPGRSSGGADAVRGGQAGRSGGQAPRRAESRDQPVKRLPGPADDRPSFARGSSSARPKRLLSTVDDENAWRANLARTREARKGRAPSPEPQPQGQPPRPAQRPRAKPIPDDWLLDE